MGVRRMEGGGWGREGREKGTGSGMGEGIGDKTRGLRE